VSEVLLLLKRLPIYALFSKGKYDGSGERYCGELERWGTEVTPSPKRNVDFFYA
jgi:hypothetical protein